MAAAFQLFSLPRGTAISSNLTLLADAKVLFQLTGTTTNTPVYQDSALTTPHTNPVIADSAGRLPAIYLDPSIIYKATFKDSADVEIYPAIDPVNDQLLSQAIIGGYLYPRTQPEIDALVTPVNYAYEPPEDVRRHGVIGDGVTDDSAAMTVAISVGKALDLGNLLVRVVTKLTFNKADQRISARGGGFLFDGAASTRLADITASGVEFHGVDFDGGAKQVKGALVYVATDAARPKFINCRTRRITGTHVGGTTTVDSNNQYGILISQYGVEGFEIAGHTFDNISNDNSGANGAAVATGAGFAGGILFSTDDFLSPTTLQTTPTSGTIHDSSFINIRTVLAGGLSSADQQSFNDADGVRFFGERTVAQTKLPVKVHDCLFYNCSKRAVKNSEAAGTMVHDVTVIATTALQYPMVCAVKVDGDDQTVKNVNISAPAASPIRFAIQSHNCAYLRVSNVVVNFCDQLWDLAPTDVNYSTHGWRVSNLQASSCTFFGVRNSTNCLEYIDCLFEGIEAVAASGVHDFTAFSLGASTARLEVTAQNCRFVGGDVKLSGYGWKLKDSYQEINDASYTGFSASIAMLEAGLTPQTAVTRDTHLENYELNVKALPDGYFSVSRPYMWLVYGDRVKVKGFKVTVPETLTPSYAHGSFGGGDDMEINDFEYSGQNFIRVGDTYTGPHRRLNIHGARRTGGTTGDNEFLYLNNGQDCEVCDVFDGRDATAGTISVNGGTVSASHVFAYIIDGVRSFSTGTSIVVDAGNKALKLNIAGFDARIQDSQSGLLDGVTAPSTVAGSGLIYIDTADGDLKIKFGDGVVKTIVVDV